MKLLWIINIIWAFSFSLIGVYLAGKVDGYFVVASRMALALMIFAPLMVKQYNKADWLRVSKVALIGTVQIGAMYLFLYHAFLYLSVAQVLLFTIMTPIYIVLINALLSQQFQPKVLLPNLAIGVLAVFGGYLVRKTEVSGDFWFGLLLVQMANLCFAFGQVAYRHLKPVELKQHIADFGWLGIGASGVCYLLWNYAATTVSASSLAVMNNVLIPLGLAVNVFFWGSGAFTPVQVIGSVIILATLGFALWLQQKSAAPSALVESQVKE